ncbi:diguanylate cyclase [Actibacterium mucosum KCTC 23349]|uniref:Diguanylate cyclase n=1 Tax=Actibacterium mucosum KCTC 23349 TaxID=1454373 RepID=A0A037ZGX4_9RHOB|nr:GGDEF domain-containing phosphodiesterase [Actibacterium mucosum]KAJ54786.1 diguanylate cyclase [Actibacterium mucosum KCTC 23349]
MDRIFARATCLTQSLFAMPQGIAFLPACSLAAFWLGGETALVIFALLPPFFYAIFGKTAQAGPTQGGTDVATGLRLRGDAVAALDSAFAHRSPATAAIVVSVEDVGDVEQRFGLPAVDIVMRKVAERLQSVLRQQDILARAEGSSFAIALAPMRRADLETVLQICARLQDAVREPVSIDATTAYVSSSIGFCLPARSPQPSGTGMMNAAETAMLEARQHGPGAIRAFSKDMQVAVAQRSELIDELAEALDTGQIRPWFQPQISTDTGEVSGFEALARWAHPERGLVPPGQFLDAIEHAGLSERLSEEILFHALSALRSWDTAGIKVPNVGVNFSGDELRNPRLVDRIQWELDRFGLTPDRLTVEVLETVVANSPDDVVVRNLAALSNLGCGIDLDDFGTGQASITSIRRFKVGRLKIDRSFVTKIDEDSEQRNLVEAILTMADRLDLDTVAEGVETSEEHAMLSQLGCGHVQGYGISRPIPFEETIAWCTSHRKKLPIVETPRRQAG